MREINLFNELWVSPPMTPAEKAKMFILLESIGIKVSQYTLENIQKDSVEYPRICRTCKDDEYFIVCCIKDNWDEGHARIIITKEELIYNIKRISDETRR